MPAFHNAGHGYTNKIDTNRYEKHFSAAKVLLFFDIRKFLPTYCRIRCTYLRVCAGQHPAHARIYHAYMRNIAQRVCSPSGVTMKKRITCIYTACYPLFLLSTLPTLCRHGLFMDFFYPILRLPRFLLFCMQFIIPRKRMQENANKSGFAISTA